MREALRRLLESSRGPAESAPAESIPRQKEVVVIGQSDSEEGPQKHLAAACHADWAWFHAHKPATLRWRKARHGEFGNYERLSRQAQASNVMVISLGDNHHLRLAFGSGVLGLYVARVQDEHPLIDLIAYTPPGAAAVGVAGAHEVCIHEADRLGVRRMWHSVFAYYADLEVGP